MDDEVAFVLAETVAGSKGENEVCGSRVDGLHYFCSCRKRSLKDRV